ncbi:MAG: hypothetical protein EBX40_01210 [Gammaproteobacteria bacterium]|nr:hypothetical protein [Gammaproteobacteria bacterium]
MNANVNNLNPTGQRFYLYQQQITNNGQLLGDQNRLYLNHTPILENSQIVGLISFSASFFFTQPKNISQQNLRNLDVLNAEYVGNGSWVRKTYLTLVNKNNQTIFSQIPISTLLPVGGKIHKYNAVNIDTRKSFFSFTPVNVVNFDVQISVGFILNYEK